MGMCSAGGPVEINILDVEDEYHCDNCGETFRFEPKGKKKPVCPACKSKKVTRA
jgi:DNA-directed RNA polymerase subunit RPC12/RpoP